MIEPARLSLNTAAVKEQWKLADCIEGCVRHGIGGIAPWRDKLIECGVGAEWLVMVVGGLSAGSRDIVAARELVAEGLERTLGYARLAGVPVAIEPLHPMYAADRACVNTLAQALDLCDLLGSGIGVALDVYHVWWDPDLAAGIERGGKRSAARVSHLPLAHADEGSAA